MQNESPSTTRSNKKLDISAFIITKDAEDYISDVINSILNIVEEIIIVDSGSKDNTLKIASKFDKVKILYNEWKGYGPQKIFAEGICKNNWVLNIDADEIISKKLSNEIISVFSQNIASNICGYKIKIVNQFFNENKPKKFAYYYNQLRLYNKKYAGFKDSTIHDSVMIKNQEYKTISLQNIAYHKSFKSFTHWVEKINYYSSLQAKNDFDKGKNISFIKIILCPFYSFLKSYLIRRYFIYGKNGIMYSIMFSFSRTIKLIKIRELFSRSKNDYKKGR